DGLVGEQDVLQRRVGRRMHGDRLDAELAAGPIDAQRDLASIRDQNLLERRHAGILRHRLRWLRNVAAATAMSRLELVRGASVKKRVSDFGERSGPVIPRSRTAADRT